MRGTVIQINISPGGLPKRPVSEAFLTPFGLEGDSSAHPNIHGGPDKALLLIASETVDLLASRGYPVFYGAMGENLTLRGIDPSQMRSGQRFRVGEAVVELTSVRAPCNSLDAYGPELKKEIFDRHVKAGDPKSPRWGMSGFYASVIQPGCIRSQDIIWLVDASV